MVAMDIYTAYVIIMAEGGGTFRNTSEGLIEFAPDHGFIISRKGSEVKIALSDFAIIRLIEFVATLPYGTLFGAWVSEGTVYLDVNDWKSTELGIGSLIVKEFGSIEEAALFLGKLRGQLAIWDCKNKCSIDVK